jgi:F-type H+-transporting ATPase subunit a
MFFIELVSYFVKSLSLGIRLSANLIAGHTLVHILFSVLLSLPIYLQNVAFFVAFFIYGAIIMFLFGLLILEFGVAFLQAYVYVLLLTMYLNDIINIDNH